MSSNGNKGKINKPEQTSGSQEKRLVTTNPQQQQAGATVSITTTSPSTTITSTVTSATTTVSHPTPITTTSSISATGAKPGQAVIPQKRDKPGITMFEQEVKGLKRKLEDAGKQVASIVCEGRKAAKEKDSKIILNFKAMSKSLDRYFIKYESLWDQLIDLHEKEDKSTDFPTQRENASMETVRRYYYEAISTLDVILAEENKLPGPSHDTQNMTSSDNSSSKHLPKISLPTFNGDLKAWPKFRDTFRSIVHDDVALTDVTKFHYLSTSLEGPAEAVISHLPIIAANYSAAWNAVVKAYDNKRLLAASYLNALLEFSPITRKPSSEQLNDFLSQVSESISAFRRLNITEESEFILYHLAVKCLDTQTREQFELQLKPDEYPKYTDLSEFIRTRVRVKEISQVGSSQQHNNANNNKHSSDSSQQRTKPFQKKSFKSSAHNKTSLIAQSSSANSANSNNNAQSFKSKSTPCPACAKFHGLFNCSLFIGATVDQRQAWLKGWSGCRSCLASTHSTNNCKSTWTCRFCKSRQHHSLLHKNFLSRTNQESNNNQPSVSRQLPEKSNDSPGIVSNFSISPSLSATSNPEALVLLGTAMVEILDCQGVKHSIRVVVDSGSQHSFITSKCVKKLGLPIQRFRNRISGIGQVSFSNTKGKAPCTLISKDQVTPVLKTDAVVVDAITSDLPHFNLPSNIVSIYKHYNLADPYFGQPRPIDFLLGADIYLDFITGDTIEVLNDGPKLLSSICGFIVMGKLPPIQFNNDFVLKSTSFFITSQGDSLQDEVKRFWLLEEPIIKDIESSPQEIACEEHFRSTHYRTEEGRYVVRLPFSKPPPDLSESSSIALKRFTSLERKFSRKSSCHEQYVAFMEEYQSLNHMSATSDISLFTIPHHPVFKDGKIRVVFDASMRTHNGSLNDFLMTGPKLQRDIKDILLTFRTHIIVIVADIVKMFRQVLINPLDRSFQHIYWRFESTGAVLKFELNTVTYGMAPAPYLAQRAIHQLTEDEGKDYPVAVKVLKRDMYVDDLCTGAETLEEAYELQTQVIELLARGCFQLGKWASNRKEILDRVEDISSQPLSLASKAEDGIKILGLQWDSNRDVFLYDITSPIMIFTKRGILSAVAKFYDPLGFLSPIIFTAKVLIQDLWKDKVDWDQPISDLRKETWTEFCHQLPACKFLSIPRLVTVEGCYRYQIVGFCDASMKGYSCVIYLKITKENIVKCNLLIAKSKLAPTQSLSIPRLELCAALLLARTYSSLSPFLQTLKETALSPYFFSDSQIALAWIKTPPYQLKTFVSHRVTEITSIIPLDQWYHVGTKDNPSDCSSRGLQPEELINHPLWWHGPSWLMQPVSSWPFNTANIEESSSEFQLECKQGDKKTSSNGLTLLSTGDCTYLLECMKRWSSFQKIINVITYLFRFVEYLKDPAKSHLGKQVSIHERRQSILFCSKIVQQYYFFQDKPPSEEKIPTFLRSLHPFLDSAGVLRVGGRLRHSNLSHDHKYPILLPECHFTICLIDYYHITYCHPGPQHLQAILQLQFWIPSLRRIVRRRTYLCMRCFKVNAEKRTITPFMGDLPDYRTKGGQPFHHVGVDFAGPFPHRQSTLRRSVISKVYMCVFVCMATKAVHLEIVGSLSTESFLACLTRFISRRGIPTCMYSDCGSNFIGAANHLQELAEWYKSEDCKSALEDFAGKNLFEWRFQPPHSPHFGGIWEAAVKSSKTILKKIVGDSALTFEEWATVLSKIESILNSRPLCQLSSSPEENDFLTPGHFLVGGHLTAPPEPSLLDININRLSRWQLVKRISEDFWKRWTREYLSTLQTRIKWTKRTSNLEVGDLVLLKDPHSPSLRWPLGKIIQVHPGADGVVRVASVKTKTTTLKRPVVALVPLPLDDPAYQENLHVNFGRRNVQAT